MANVLQSIMIFLKKGNILSHILTVSFFDMVSKVFSTATLILLIRMLSTPDYAQFSFFYAVSLFISSIIGSGLNTSYIRYESENISRNNNCTVELYVYNVKILTLIHFIFLLICIIFKEFIGIILFKDSLYGNLVVFGILFAYILSVQKLNESYYQSRSNFKIAGLLSSARSFLLLISILFLYIFNFMSDFYIIFIYIVISFIISLILFINIYRFDVYKKNNFTSYRNEYIKASVWLILYCFFVGIFTQVDTFFVTHFLGEESLANYGVATKYYFMLLSLLPSITVVLRVRTSMADMVDSIIKQRNFGVTWIKKASLIIAPLVLIGIILAKYIFPIVNGILYDEAIIPFQILCIGAGISYVFSPNINILMSMKRYRLLSLLSFISCSICIFLNYKFVKYYGINSAAIITVLANAVNNVTASIIVIYLTKKIKL